MLIASDVVGWHAKKGDRWAALEPVRQGVRHGRLRQGDRPGPRPAARLAYRARQFQAEIKWLGIRSTPAYVGEPECNGVAERFSALTLPMHARVGHGYIGIRGFGRA